MHRGYSLVRSDRGFVLYDPSGEPRLEMDPIDGLIYLELSRYRSKREVCESVLSASPDSDSNEIEAHLLSITEYLVESGIATLKNYRPLPDFVIAGAQKSGTTALSENLKAHPDAFLTEPSELHFFDEDGIYGRGLDWYTQYFQCPGKLRGEKTPDYLREVKCHRRMGDLIPHAKLIVLLRNPVHRAYSQWNHFNQISERSKKWGWKVLAFEDSIETNKSILQGGLYAEQMKSLFRYFRRDQVYVGIQERFKMDPDHEYRKVCAYLKISPPDNRYESAEVRSYPQMMKPETRRRLKDYYAQANEELFALLGYRIDEWGLSGGVAAAEA